VQFVKDLINKGTNNYDMSVLMAKTIAAAFAFLWTRWGRHLFAIGG
jgi:ABC-type xylose transport system permease subunit